MSDASTRWAVIGDTAQKCQNWHSDSAPVFCDWLTLSVPVASVPPWLERVIESRTGDDVHWRRPGWVDVRGHDGSASTLVRLRYMPESGRLRIDGNLGRWMRSSSVWGMGVYQAGRRFLDHQAAKGILQTGPADVTRVDLTCNVSFDSQRDAYDWLRWATTIRLGRKAPQQYETGVTWRTKRWYAKVYDKVHDLRRHGHHALAETLLDHEGYILRLELTLRTDELHRLGYRTLDDYMHKDHDMAVIFTGRFRPLIQGRGATVDDLIREMPTRLACAVQAWRNGIDFRREVADGKISRRTYYRLKAEVMEYGIDISIPSNVTTLTIKPREITARFVAEPEWHKRMVA